MAGSLRGQVLNLVPDEEGLKVIAEVPSTGKPDIRVLFLKNDHPEYQKYNQLLSNSKSAHEPLKIEIRSGDLIYIEKVQK